MINRAFRLNTARLFLVVLLALAAVLLAGCGGGDDDDDGGEPTGAATTAPADASPTEIDGPADPGTVSINEAFWHSGFRVELGDGTVTKEENALTGEVTYVLTIDATFENLGPSETFFDGDMAVVAGGNSFPAGIGHRQLNVPSGLSSSGEITFIVDQAFDPQNAHLLVGAAGENQARVPLGPGGGELVDLAPSEPAVTGEISMELIDLTFTSAELRADVPESYRQVDEEKLALTLNFDATSRRQGSWNIHAQDFALVLPGGGAAGVDGSELASLPGSEAGTDTTDLFVRFLVEEPVAGEYTLRFTPGSWFVGEDGVDEATFTFELS